MDTDNTDPYIPKPKEKDKKDPYGKRKIESNIQKDDYLRSFNKDNEQVEETTRIFETIATNDVKPENPGETSTQPIPYRIDDLNKRNVAQGDECLCLRIQTKNSDIKDLAEDLAISWTAINEYTNTAEVEIKEVNNKIIELFEPNKITTEIQPKLLHLKDLSIPKDWIIGDINNASTSKPVSTIEYMASGLMDRGKKPLMGEWNTVHKPNKGKITKSNQGFVPMPPQVPFYPNQGYYVPYPMVRPPIGSQFSLTPNPVCQSQWSQDPNSAFQTSYAEIIKGAENFLSQQSLSEINDFYNPGLPLEYYNYMNKIWKTHVLEQRANFRRALTNFSQFLVEKTTKENIIF
ncbi:hypothetical protein J1N35_000291 [Gossypium stocksii]|uniref:Uncharacterized protein n=1 Tax=Gossypium stocksii TaxID=47602 RepID=A0A9D4AKN3_9ROSI|nr:hypothetical protein J1N35_000291 [Gossypium stocksii]